MLKTLLATILALFTAMAFAAVDVNKADQAELETVKGIGPSISTKILAERKKGAFKDWTDLVDRVQGVGPGNAARFSADGLTVNGSAFNGVATTAKEPKGKKNKTGATTGEDVTTGSAAATGKKKSKADKSGTSESQ